MCYGYGTPHLVPVTARLCISGKVEPIALTSGTPLGTDEMGGPDKSVGFSLGTYTRARPTSTSQELVGQLPPKLVCC